MPGVVLGLQQPNAPGGGPSLPVADAELDGRAAAVARRLTASVFGVSEAVLRGPTRGRGAAPLARQVAMYLVHVELGVTQTRIAAAFGRDRSTVGHACLAIEQRRDDPAFDDMMEALARIFRRLVLGPPGWLPLETAS